MQKNRNARKQERPKRFRVARRDASIETIQRNIEKDYGLPSDSVRLVSPNGRKVRKDASVNSFLKNWG